MELMDYNDALEIVRIARQQAFGKNDLAYDLLSWITRRLKESARELENTF